MPPTTRSRAAPAKTATASGTNASDPAASTISDPGKAEPTTASASAPTRQATTRGRGGRGLGRGRKRGSATGSKPRGKAAITSDRSVVDQSDSDLSSADDFKPAPKKKATKKKPAARADDADDSELCSCASRSAGESDTGSGSEFEDDEPEPVKGRKRSAKATTISTRTAAARAKRAKTDQDDAEPEGDDGEQEKPAKKTTKKGVATPKKPRVSKKKSADNPDEMIPRLLNARKLVGAHVSAAGGPENAVKNGLKIGYLCLYRVDDLNVVDSFDLDPHRSCNAMSFFLKSSRSWKSKPLSDESIAAFKQECSTHVYDAAVTMIPHGSYLVNLGNPDAEKRHKSYEFFLDEMQRCDALGIKFYNFHPGSTVGECTEDECITHIATEVNKALAATTSVMAVIENTAGQGNNVGYKWEHLRDLIAQIKDKDRVGVCLDTCHLFAAGYDIRTREAYEETIREFDALVGLKYLKAFHDVAKDRHAPLGDGKIGLEPFKYFMQDPRFDHLLFILETPEEDKWPAEIALLHSYMNKTGTPEKEGQVEQN
ncbi:apurinic endonuclease (APN1) [Allomyces macrogynus ATCC 38327]|uniref:Apurinic-apyrimidinic endonuclease 1 n=1 Tax=Allomyces macrogynus (strain ATCC 38327) TaxID=578462 RepID=A0A0L0SG07_ALLM3|nr:apurinic endonuclease (APN1) [Allomyces macrogynus ATCC 38327]|eukprot:KNE61379.1 apurinic endonuclease (APN1) [Allomyces macrogynus ATCC 38327]